MSTKNEATNPIKNKANKNKSTVNDTEAKTCMVCGKISSRIVTNRDYPGKFICLSCFNGFMFNLKTLEEEIEPFVDELSRRLDTLDKDMDRK